MESKSSVAHKSGLIVFAVVMILVALAIVYWVVSPFFNGKGELMFIGRMIVLLMAVMAFAMLRMYNAIVQNTRFSIELHKSVLELRKMIPNLEREIRNNTSNIGSLRSNVEQTRKAVVTNSEVITELIQSHRK